MRGKLAGVGMLLTVGTVLVLTLTPSVGPGQVAEGFWRCLLCGDRGVADALLNVALFLPLGFFLSLLTGAPVRSLVALVLFSAALEVFQLWIPGRYSSPGDLVFNSLGAATGILLAFRGVLLVRPLDRHRRVVQLLAFVVASGTVGATALLHAQRLTEGRYRVRWTPEIDHLEPYRGRVIRATLGDRPLDPGVQDGPGRIGAGLGRGHELVLHLQVGPRPARLAPLLTVHDHHEREILFLGLQGDDLIFRVRRLADALRLDRPDIRLQSAIHRDVDTAMVLRVDRRSDGSYCLGTEELTRCGLGVGPADGWSFLLSPVGLSETTRSLLRGAWLFALFVPVGYLAAGWKGQLSAVALLVGLLYGVPLVTTLTPTPPSGWAGAFTGLLAGLALTMSAHSRPGPTAPRA